MQASSLGLQCDTRETPPHLQGNVSLAVLLTTITNLLGSSFYLSHQASTHTHTPTHLAKHNQP